LAWNIKNIEIAVKCRLSARASLVALLGAAKNIRPEGTGKELFDSVNFAVSDTPDTSNHRLHNVTLYLYIDTQDRDGKSGRDQAIDIAAELVSELHHDSQEEETAAFLNLSFYGYRVMEQQIEFNPSPLATGASSSSSSGGNPATFRLPQRWRLVVVDQS
jgi:hypothetical protein